MSERPFAITIHPCLFGPSCQSKLLSHLLCPSDHLRNLWAWIAASGIGSLCEFSVWRFGGVIAVVLRSMGLQVMPTGGPFAASCSSFTATVSDSSGTAQVTEREKAKQRARPSKEQALNCPRCNSSNTKFCYYNNYSRAQPRYFCKTCRRYWTQGGSLRNVPVGGGSRKNKRPISLSTTTTSNAAEIHQLELVSKAPKLLFHDLPDDEFNSIVLGPLIMPVPFPDYNSNGLFGLPLDGSAGSSQLLFPLEQTKHAVLTSYNVEAEKLEQNKEGDYADPLPGFWNCIMGDDL